MIYVFSLLQKMVGVDDIRKCGLMRWEGQKSQSSLRRLGEEVIILGDNQDLNHEGFSAGNGGNLFKSGVRPK